jgi:hypothetical protein
MAIAASQYTVTLLLFTMLAMIVLGVFWAKTGASTKF